MDWLRKVMAGRYGTDQLSVALLILYAVLYLSAQIARLPLLAWIALIPFVLCFFRMFSRNITKRYQENNVFLKYWNPVRTWFQREAGMLKDQKTHRYYKCPKCSSRLRVPRGRGKIRITCPVCKTEFIKKT